MGLIPLSLELVCVDSTVAKSPGYVMSLFKAHAPFARRFVARSRTKTSSFHCGPQPCERVVWDVLSHSYHSTIGCLSRLTWSFLRTTKGCIKLVLDKILGSTSLCPQRCQSITHLACFFFLSNCTESLFMEGCRKSASPAPSRRALPRETSSAGHESTGMRLPKYIMYAHYTSSIHFHL